MEEITLILLSAGGSTRFGLGCKKQWLYQNREPLWLKVAKDFESSFSFREIVVVAHETEKDYMSLFADYRFVTGGNSRQESLKNALESVKSGYVLVSDVARCCIDTEMVQRILSHMGEADCIVPAIGVADTVYLGAESVERDRIKLIQTPQLSDTAILRKALENGEYTDESSAIVGYGGSVLFVEGSHSAHKLTRVEDLKRIPCLKPPSPIHFCGFGIDTHSFEDGKKMYICGVEIDSPFGFRAHSDGDVAIHALIDALLGASGLGDIGSHFPDDDSSYEGVDSALLLEKSVEMVRSVGFEIVNVDMTIVAEVPRLARYRERMRRRVAEIVGLRADRVSIKATTSEKMGFIGRKEGVTVHATATLGYFDWTEAV